MKNTVENEIGTLEQMEQRFAGRYNAAVYTESYMARLSVLDEGRRGKKVHLEFGGKGWVMDKYSIVLKSKSIELINIQGTNDLQRIEILDLIFLDKTFAVLRLKREGEAERYSAILYSDNDALRYSLYLGCQEDEKVFWFANIHPAQAEHFITIHESSNINEERELRRFNSICVGTMLER